MFSGRVVDYKSKSSIVYTLSVKITPSWVLLIHGASGLFSTTVGLIRRTQYINLLQDLLVERTAKSRHLYRRQAERQFPRQILRVLPQRDLHALVYRAQAVLLRENRQLRDARQILHYPALLQVVLDELDYLRRLLLHLRGLQVVPEQRQRLQRLLRLVQQQVDQRNVVQVLVQVVRPIEEVEVLQQLRARVQPIRRVVQRL